MREIKFRAWHKEIKEMFQVGQITLEKGGWDYQPDNRKHIGLSIPYQPSFILMQYTGLHDKKGKEIYEGDILQIDVDRAYVIWNEKYCYFELVPIGDYYFDSNVIGHILEYLDVEVIGNIYNNKELVNETNR